MQPRCFTPVVYIPRKQWRVTGVCVQYKPLSAGQVWVRLSRKQQAKFKKKKKKRLPLKESLGSQHLEECTGADTRQQTIPANTWSIWHFAGAHANDKFLWDCDRVSRNKRKKSTELFFLCSPPPLLSPVLLYCGQVNPSTLSCSFMESQLMVV